MVIALDQRQGIGNSYTRSGDQNWGPMDTSAEQQSREKENDIGNVLGRAATKAVLDMAPSPLSASNLLGGLSMPGNLRNGAIDAIGNLLGMGDVDPGFRYNKNDPTPGLITKDEGRDIATGIVDGLGSNFNTMQRLGFRGQNALMGAALMTGASAATDIMKALQS